ncbi:uncharacterized protein (TIGR00266 family) [Caldicoprobacter guelmensis]|uniref:TIGR00266 family protein n=1 Tax=Caldicoprobacter guelmensis TaxID=1170224 RepID=UPI0019588D33|nr:TIGR00266 family protein [Caldicoprobacter guelmensis]MBM7581861.1 uncharacterized protein (TIGR00266 family) [Caldicoprobacter guelmensis]
MEYRIIGENLPAVIFKLRQGESVITEAGGMCWMSEGIEMDTNMKGGFFKGLGRAISGESVFISKYTCSMDGAEIAFASSFPGKIMPIVLEPGQSIICQKGAFLCGESSVEVSVHLVKKLGAGLFGGEGFVLQKITGPGTVFLEVDGSAVEYTLSSGEVLKVDTGHIVAFEPTVEYDVITVKGFKNLFFGGEGLFLSKLTGPGKVMLQTLPISNLVRNISPYIANLLKDKC